MIIDDQAFLWSYDLAPHHPTTPPPSPTFLSASRLFLCFPVCRRSSLLTGGVGGRGGRGAKSYAREKAWPSVNHSILSGFMPSKLISSCGKHANMPRTLTQTYGESPCMNLSYHNFIKRDKVDCDLTGEKFSFTSVHEMALSN
jgi:hypothetical protein